MPKTVEEIKAQLAALEADAEPVAEPTPILSVSKTALNRNWAEACWETFLKGKPDPDMPEELREPRYQLEHPAGSDPKAFRVGQWYIDPFKEVHDRTNKSKDYNPWQFREALPRPRYPEPGALLTPEIEMEYLIREGVWNKANHYLEQLIRLRAYKLRGIESGCSPAGAIEAEASNFLCGAWAARGNTSPTDDQITEWANEFADRLYGKQSSSQSEQKPAPSEANPARTNQTLWDGIVRSPPR